jgi:hypothetical protein
MARRGFHLFSNKNNHNDWAIVRENFRDLATLLLRGHFFLFIIFRSNFFSSSYFSLDGKVAKDQG